MGNSPHALTPQSAVKLGAWFSTRTVEKGRDGMPQIFRRSSNTLARAFLVGGALFFFLMWGVVYAIYRSPYTTNQNVPRVQPVPFSHEHHYSGLGMACRNSTTRFEPLVSGGFLPREPS